MAVREHLETLSTLQGGEAPWWSPLSPSEVEQQLSKLGAERLVHKSRRERFAFAVSDDMFAASLVVESRAAAHGSLFWLHAEQLGFARDFNRVVQGGLTLFFLFVAASAGFVSSGANLWATLVAIGLIWAIVMGLFAGIRVLVHPLVENRRAHEKLCGKVRTALFARAL